MTTPVPTTTVEDTLQNCIRMIERKDIVAGVGSKIAAPLISVILGEEAEAHLSTIEATYGSLTEPNHEMLMEISELLAAPLASFASNLFGHIICFLITFFFFKWINLQIRKRRVPVLRYIDHIFGFIVGTSIGCAVVVGGSILARTVFQIILAFNGDSTIMSIYDNSYIFKFLGDLDIVGIFSQLFSK